jgi:CBS domain-containing protein
MKAQDLMSTPVVSVTPDTPVFEVARVLLSRGISAVPVIADGVLAGIVSEGDLMLRKEIGTAPVHSWLASILTSGEISAAEFLRTRGQRAKDVMTRSVVTVGRQTTIKEIVQAFEANSIKRVVVLDQKTVVGVVSRRDVLRALVKAHAEKSDVHLNPDEVRAMVLANIAQAGLASFPIELKITGDCAEIAAEVGSEVIAQAMIAAVDSAPGIKSVKSAVRVVRPIIGAV